MSAAFRRIRDDFEARKKNYLNLEKNMAVFLEKRIYPMYQNFQAVRWQTENASEGKTWTEASTAWRAYKVEQKKKDSSAYPGGDRTLYYTGALQASVVGREKSGTKWHRVMTKPRQITITTTIPYGDRMAKMRPFMDFGSKSKEAFKAEIRSYLANVLKGRTS